MTKEITNRSNKDIKSIVDKFVLTVSQLQAILAKETDYLKVADRDGFLNMQEEKVTIAQSYQRDIFAVKNVAQALKAKYPGLVPYLQDKQAKLSATIGENEAALIRMEKSTSRLSDRIMNIARETAIEQNSVVYGSAGKLDKTKRASMGVSESA